MNNGMEWLWSLTACPRKRRQSFHKVYKVVVVVVVVVLLLLLLFDLTLLNDTCQFLHLISIDRTGGGFNFGSQVIITSPRKMSYRLYSSKVCPSSSIQKKSSKYKYFKATISNPKIFEDNNIKVTKYFKNPNLTSTKTIVNSTIQTAGLSIFFKQITNRKFFLKPTYHAIVRSDIALCALASDTFQVTVLMSQPETLYSLVSITTKKIFNSSTLIDLNAKLSALESITKLNVVSSDNQKCLTLVSLTDGIDDFSSQNPSTYAIYKSLKNASLNAQPNILTNTTPKKYLKFLNREKLFVERKKNLANSDNGSQNIVFNNLPLFVPASCLLPRTSSLSVVNTVVRLLCEKRTHCVSSKCGDEEEHATDAFKILDIGTGVGTLLLSSVNEFHRLSVLDTFGQQVEGAAEGSSMAAINRNYRLYGVGLDIDTNALHAAKENAKNNKLDSCLSWLHADFNLLHLIDDKDFRSKYFDVIFSNPPYLSEQSVKSRITNESSLSLLAGSTGLECYEAISKSLLQCKDVFSYDSFLVFQLPGGKSFEHVANRIIPLGLKMIDVVQDERGINRCLILKRA